VTSRFIGTPWNLRHAGIILTILPSQFQRRAQKRVRFNVLCVLSPDLALKKVRDKRDKHDKSLIGVKRDREECSRWNDACSW
jgi:hypothetical protein